eukprot:Gb_03113 [translate_table: standard]
MTPRVTDEDITLGVEGLKGMSLHTNLQLPEMKVAMNDFSKLILEGLRKLMLDNWEEQPLRYLSEDLPGDKGDIVSEDSELDKILKRLQTPFNTHKNSLYTKSSTMAMKEKSSASRGIPTLGANPNPFNTFKGGPTPQMPTSQTFNPFATYGPTTTNPNSGGAPNPMPFELLQFRNYEFNLGENLGMPNFSYGFNEGFHYTPYLVPGYQLKNTMQYPLSRESFRFGGPFALPFTNNRTPSMLNSNNNYGGIGNSGSSGNNGNGGNGSSNSSQDGSGALMNYFVDGLLPTYREKIKIHPMSPYEQVRDLAFEYENQVETMHPTQRYYVGGEPTCWNVNKGDPKNRETPKLREAKFIEKLIAKIKRMKIKLNEKEGVNEKQTKQRRKLQCKCLHEAKKKTNTKQVDRNFLNPKKEKDRFIAAKEALDATGKEAQAKKEVVKKVEEELEQLCQEKAKEEISIMPHGILCPVLH